MKLENEFTVAAPIDKTWETLLDIERVATCLPGATIEPGGDDGAYKGRMKVKLGPMTVNYRGTARFQDVDEDRKVAAIEVQAREAKGQGTAAAVITNSLESSGDGGTKVTAVTDLKVTGRQAQFGRGIMQDVAGSMMNEFASRLEKEILEGGKEKPSAEPAAAGPAGEPTDAAEEEALDMGNVLAGAPMMKYAAPAAAAVGLLLLVLLVKAVAGSRNGYTLNINVKR